MNNPGVQSYVKNAKERVRKVQLRSSEGLPYMEERKKKHFKHNTQPYLFFSTLFHETCQTKPLQVMFACLGSPVQASQVEYGRKFLNDLGV